MRRRRQVLQVSTFPFLAVLLCTMGSLILLLLVIDRRAHAAAKEKALRAQLEATKEDEQKAAAYLAELERRRRETHQRLAQQNSEVESHLMKMRVQLQTTAERKKEEEARRRELERLLQATRQELARIGQGVDAERNEATAATQGRKAVQGEMARLSAEIQLLEQTVANLKLLRQRDAQTYSLVPYHGRRGESRRPLYVECTAQGLIFHPDRVRLEGLSVTLADVRNEVLQRIQRQNATVLARGQQPDKTPYLLMLIRPEGVLSYERAIAALRGLKIDFGYELIDCDWILDFPDRDDIPVNQPWLASNPSPKNPIPAAPAGTPSRSVVGLQSPLMGESRPGQGISSGGLARGQGAGSEKNGTDAQGNFNQPLLGKTQNPQASGMNYTGNGQFSSPGTGSSSVPGSSISGVPTPGAGSMGTTSTPGTSIPGLDPNGINSLWPRGSGTAAGVPSPWGQGAVPPPGAYGGIGYPVVGPARSGPGGPFGNPGFGNSVPDNLAKNATGVAPGPGTIRIQTAVNGGYPGNGFPNQAGSSGNPVGNKNNNGPYNPLFSGSNPSMPSNVPTSGSWSASGFPGVGGKGGTGSGGASSGSGSGNASGGGYSAVQGRPIPGMQTGSGPASGSSANASAGTSAGAPGTSSSPVAGDPSMQAGAPQPGMQAGMGNTLPPPGTSGIPPPGTQAGSGNTPSPGVSSGGGDMAVPQQGSSVPQRGGYTSTPNGTDLDGESHATPMPSGIAQFNESRRGSAQRAPAPLQHNRIFIGKRDWVIQIECRADGVGLYPLGPRHPQYSLAEASSPSDKNPLAQTIRTTIDRLQKSVRPGEPPFRPQIRFLVHGNSWRTYYLVYPTLDSLRIPMTWQALDDSDNRRYNNFNR